MLSPSSSVILGLSFYVSSFTFSSLQRHLSKILQFVPKASLSSSKPEIWSFFISAGQYISGTGTKLVFCSTRLHGKNKPKHFIVPLPSSSLWFIGDLRQWLITVLSKMLWNYTHWKLRNFSWFPSWSKMYFLENKFLACSELCSWVFLWWSSWWVEIAHERQVHSPAGEAVARLES